MKKTITAIVFSTLFGFLAVEAWAQGIRMNPGCGALQPHPGFIRILSGDLVRQTSPRR